MPVNPLCIRNNTIKTSKSLCLLPPDRSEPNFVAIKSMSLYLNPLNVCHIEISSAKDYWGKELKVG